MFFFHAFKQVPSVVNDSLIEQDVVLYDYFWGVLKPYKCNLYPLPCTANLLFLKSCPNFSIKFIINIWNVTLLLYWVVSWRLTGTRISTILVYQIFLNFLLISVPVWHLTKYYLGLVHSQILLDFDYYFFELWFNF